MANRFPLIANPSANQIQELAAGDNLDLTSSGISNVGNILSVGIITASSFRGDGSQLTNITSGVGINTAGGNVGYGATLLDFRGTAVSTITISSGIATLNITGGTIADNTSTNATYYVGIASTTLGNLSTLNVSSTKLTFNPSTGNLVVGGTVTANSDQKLKVGIQTIENALDKVLSLRGVEFTRIDNGDKQIGVIAQEVQEIIPQVVYPKQSVENDETKSVAYGNLVGLLIEAIKEQNVKIAELERKIEER